MSRNFGIYNVDQAQRIDEEKKVEFWTGFITGGISAAFTLAVIIGIVVWNLPVN